MDTSQVIARFEAERQALAMMDHQHIARVLDAGATETGRPYFVMELVKGVPITEYCDRNKLTPRDRLGLFVPACQAIQHAHQKGVIHRDIKPSNVLVCLYDGKPVPKVIDFGVAKAIDQRLTERTMFTQHGQIVGTLEYMSPEQAELNQLDIDTRSDIYSLGVLLYELLTGSTPIPKEKLREAAFVEILRSICEDDPERPSTRLSGSGDALPIISEKRRTDLRKLGALLRGELDWIVMKSLEKDRTRRYESAVALAADIEYYLHDEPVTACPPSTWYTLRKLANRHRVAVVTAVGFIGILVFAGLACLGWAIEASSARDQAVANLGRAEAAEASTREERDNARQARDREADARKTAEEQRQRAEGLAAETRQRLVRSHVSKGLRLMEEGDLIASLPWFAQALKLDERNATSGQIHRLRLANVLQECPKLVQAWFPPNEIGAFRVAEFSPDGRRVVTAGASGTMTDLLNSSPTVDCRVWDLHTAQPVTPPIKLDGFLYDVSFSPDGNRFTTACQDGTARVWHVATGEPATPVLKHDRQVRYARFSVDGKRLVTAADDGVRLWDAHTGELVTQLSKGSARDASFSPDGRRVVAAVMGSVQVWDTNGEPMIPAISHDSVYTVTFSPDGRYILSAGFNKIAQVWNAETGEPVTAPLKHGKPIYDAAFSPDNRLMATVGADRLAWLWDSKTGELTAPPLQHGDSVLDAQFAPDGKRLLTTEGNVVRVWNVESGKLSMPLLWGTQVMEDVRFSPDGRFVATTGDAVRIWDTKRTNAAVETLVQDQTVLHAAFSPDGRRVVTGSRIDGAKGEARVWDAATGQPIGAPILHRGAVVHVCFSSDGRRVLTASADKTVRIWDADTANPLTPPMEHRNAVGHASFDPDCRRVVTASGSDRAITIRHPDGTKKRIPPSNEVRVWDAKTGKSITAIPHSSPVSWSMFHPDGLRILTIATTRDDPMSGKVRAWNAETGEASDPPLEHPAVKRAVFSPDGRRLATMGYDVRVWEAASNKLVATIGTPISFKSGLTDVEFSPDGRRLVTATGRRIGDPGKARVWDAESGEALSPPMIHDVGIQDVAFNHDGSLVVAASGHDSPGRDSGAVRVWDAATGEPVTTAIQTRGAALVASFSQDGTRILVASREWGRDGAGQAILLNLASSDQPADDLIEISMLLSGRRIDPAGGFVAADIAALRRAWQTLHTKYPTLFEMPRE